MATLVGLAVHSLSYWATLWLFRFPPGDWVLAYAAGAAFFLANAWYPKLRLTVSQSMQLVGYSFLLAVLLFGVNSAREALGNSVRVNRVHQSTMEPHFFLVPGVMSIGLGALAASLLRRAASREA